MTIPFVDLQAQYASISDEIQAAIAPILEETRFVGGWPVHEFEEAFADYCQTRFAIGVANGTDALHLALRALEIGPGDEVITAANSFIATAAAIEMVGAHPVLVDIDPETYTIDPDLIQAAITTRTRAIIPVHLYGQPADMAPIMDIARRQGIAVIEDAAQAHGAEYHGQRIGSIGDIACFSFYPAKNLGAYGDGGAITTNAPELADRIRLLQDHGRTSKYEHALIGLNSRLDSLQARVLSVKLRHLDQWNRQRQRAAGWYGEALSETGLKTPAVRPGSTHVYHLYVVECWTPEQREEITGRFEQQGIGTGVHYPLPLHLQPALRHLGYSAGDFPRTEAAAGRILSLPMFPELTREQIERVAATTCTSSRVAIAAD